MSLEFEELRPRYRLSRAGFGLIAISLGLLCLHSSCWLVCDFTRDQNLFQFLRGDLCKWIVGAPITWASLIGSYLLWGRWKEPVWQRRAGLLVLLNFLDLITWAIDHSADFGFKVAGIDHPWLRHNVTSAFQWVELYLTASLAIDLILHLGSQPPDFGRAATSFAAIGLAIGVLAFLIQTNWDAGWPLSRKPMIGKNLILAFFIELGELLILAVTTFLVTALCVAAASRTGRYLADLDRYMGQEHELLRSRSEVDDEFLKR